MSLLLLLADLKGKKAELDNKMEKGKSFETWNPREGEQKVYKHPETIYRVFYVHFPEVKCMSLRVISNGCHQLPFSV